MKYFVLSACVALAFTAQSLAADPVQTPAQKDTAQAPTQKAVQKDDIASHRWFGHHRAGRVRVFGSWRARGGC